MGKRGREVERTSVGAAKVGEGERRDKGEERERERGEEWERGRGGEGERSRGGEGERPPAVIMAVATAVALLRRQSRAQMKALDLLYPSASRNWCRGGIKAFRLAILSATARIHWIRAVTDKVVATPIF